mmetsp:Transcript_965/g.4078  ORF Transcript_965/g.4078 Transcript_965/m.4078 type:complete len:255 (-) Transcript_965:1802-2566(-)
MCSNCSPLRRNMCNPLSADTHRLLNGKSQSRAASEKPRSRTSSSSPNEHVASSKLPRDVTASPMKRWNGVWILFSVRKMFWLRKRAVGSSTWTNIRQSALLGSSKLSRRVPSMIRSWAIVCEKSLAQSAWPAGSTGKSSAAAAAALSRRPLKNVNEKSPIAKAMLKAFAQRIVSNSTWEPTCLANGSIKCSCRKMRRTHSRTRLFLTRSVAAPGALKQWPRSDMPQLLYLECMTKGSSSQAFSIALVKSTCELP